MSNRRELSRWKTTAKPNAKVRVRFLHQEERDVRSMSPPRQRHEVHDDRLVEVLPDEREVRDVDSHARIGSPRTSQS